MAVCRKPVHSHHEDVKWWGCFSLKHILDFSIWTWAAEMLPFKFRVYIPAQHQMCNDVIAGRAYTSGLPESCDLSAWRAASPKLNPGCCGGDRSPDIIISPLLSPGHPGSLFVCFTSPVTGNAQLSTARIQKKKENVKNALLRTETSLHQAKPNRKWDNANSHQMALIGAGVYHIYSVTSKISP